MLLSLVQQQRSLQHLLLPSLPKLSWVQYPSAPFVSSGIDPTDTPGSNSNARVQRAESLSSLVSAGNGRANSHASSSMGAYEGHGDGTMQGQGLGQRMEDGEVDSRSSLIPLVSHSHPSVLPRAGDPTQTGLLDYIVPERKSILVTEQTNEYANRSAHRFSSGGGGGHGGPASGGLLDSEVSITVREIGLRQEVVYLLILSVSA